MIKRTDDGYFDINGKKARIKHFNPCAHCEFEAKCDDEMNEFCKSELQMNEYFEYISQPPIDSWEDFYSVNWNTFGAVKFHARPLKFMTSDEAKQVVEHINDTVN